MLDELAALGPFFAVSTHPADAAPVSPWRPVSELTGRHALRDRLDSVRAALAARGGRDVAEIDQRVAASALHLGVVARLAAPALGAAVLGHPIDMRPAGIWWQDVVGGPVPLSVPVPLPVTAPAAAAAAPAGTTDQWDQALMAEVIAPVTAATARLVPVSPRVLWGNVASGVNAAARQVAARRPELAADAWRAAARLFASQWLRGERNPPGPAFRRSSCCLFYQLAPAEPAARRSGNSSGKSTVDPSAICGDCVLGARHDR